MEWKHLLQLQSMLLFTVSRRVEGVLLIGIETENIGIPWLHGDSNNPSLIVEKYFARA